MNDQNMVQSFYCFIVSSIEFNFFRMSECVHVPGALLLSAGFVHALGFSRHNRIIKPGGCGTITHESQRLILRSYDSAAVPNRENRYVLRCIKNPDGTCVKSKQLSDSTYMIDVSWGWFGAPVAPLRGHIPL